MLRGQPWVEPGESGRQRLRGVENRGDRTGNAVGGGDVATEHGDGAADHPCRPAREAARMVGLGVQPGERGGSTREVEGFRLCLQRGAVALHGAHDLLRLPTLDEQGDHAETQRGDAQYGQDDYMASSETATAGGRAGQLHRRRMARCDEG